MTREDAHNYALSKKNKCEKKLEMVLQKPNHKDEEVNNIQKQIDFYNFVLDSTKVIEYINNI